MKETVDFKERKTPAGLRVFQVTESLAQAHLVYPDQPSFLTHNRLVLHGPAGYYLCDLKEAGALRPLPVAVPVQGLHVTPDGRHLILVRLDRSGEGRLSLYRMDAGTLCEEQVFQAGGTVPGMNLPVTRLNVMTVSSDAKRVGAMAWLGDGHQAGAPFGIFSIDLERGDIRLVVEDPCFNNPHLQYCRSSDPDASHDLMIQMNHGSLTDAEGKTLCGLGPPSDGGADVHVIRDDGTHWRDLPWGQDGKESCIGHQVWRGRSDAAVTVTLQNQDTSYGWADHTRQEVIAAWPVKADRARHLGRLHRRARRINLSQGYRHPRFCHLCTDASGLKFVFDTFPIYDELHAGMQILIGHAPDETSPLKFKYLLNSGITFNKANGYHAHPIISPDGQVVLFNSNISGVSHVYAVTDYEF